MKLKEAISSFLEDFDDDENDPVAQHIGGSYRTKKFRGKSPALSHPSGDFGEWAPDPEGKPSDPMNVFAAGDTYSGPATPPKSGFKSTADKSVDRQVAGYNKIRAANRADKANQAYIRRKKGKFKLGEAFPKPGQPPLGGVSPEQAKIRIPEWGVLTFEQVFKEVEKLSKELSHYLESHKPEKQSERSQTSAVSRQTDNRYVVANLKMVSDKLNLFLPALIQHLEGK